jgi:hypothetical protein
LAVFFLAVLGFELRVLCLLDKYSVTTVMPPALFALVIFLNKVSLFAWASSDYDPIYTLLCSWDDRCVLPCPGLLAEKRGGPLNFLPGLALN